MKQYTYNGKKWYDLKEGAQVPLQAIETRDKTPAETWETSRDFIAGELMAWQEMSRLVRELLAVIEDLKIRLDDAERAIGEHDRVPDPDEPILYQIRTLPL